MNFKAIFNKLDEINKKSKNGFNIPIKIDEKFIVNIYCTKSMSKNGLKYFLLKIKFEDKYARWKELLYSCDFIDDFNFDNYLSKCEESLYFFFKGNYLKGLEGDKHPINMIKNKVLSIKDEEIKKYSTLSRKDFEEISQDINKICSNTDIKENLGWWKRKKVCKNGEDERFLPKTKHSLNLKFNIPMSILNLVDNKGFILVTTNNEKYRNSSLLKTLRDSAYNHAEKLFSNESELKKFNKKGK